MGWRWFYRMSSCCMTVQLLDVTASTAHRVMLMTNSPTIFVCSESPYYSSQCLDISFYFLNNKNLL